MAAKRSLLIGKRTPFPCFTDRRCSSTHRFDELKIFCNTTSQEGCHHLCSLRSVGSEDMTPGGHVLWRVCKATSFPSVMKAERTGACNRRLTRISQRTWDKLHVMLTSPLGDPMIEERFAPWSSKRWVKHCSQLFSRPIGVPHGPLRCNTSARSLCRCGTNDPIQNRGSTSHKGLSSRAKSREQRKQGESGSSEPFHERFLMRCGRYAALRRWRQTRLQRTTLRWSRRDRKWRLRSLRMKYA